jgi:thymidylate synthase (FAD)
MTINSEELFHELKGEFNASFPSIPSQVFHTSKGVPYLKNPGTACIGRTMTSIDNMRDFLYGFDNDFPEYLLDSAIPEGKMFLDGAELCKTAGQLCYMSFGPNRTKNNDAEKYFNNVKQQKHGSILEHANFSFLFYGISRSLTHELVRHRAGFAYSQVSQRYVSGKTLRFVERPEYQTTEDNLHWIFERRIDDAHEDYHHIADILIKMQKSGNDVLSAEAKTDLRKKVRQAARSVLPNETESPIIVTGNARAWRHFLEMRASEHAEVEIRELAVRVFLCLYQIDPILFGDYQLEQLKDGTYALSTEYRKV